MNSTTLFDMALGLQYPWQVKEVLFSETDTQAKELHLRIGFAPGSRFPDESGNLCPVHDTVERE
jgi:transposase